MEEILHQKDGWNPTNNGMYSTILNWCFGFRWPIHCIAIFFRQNHGCWIFLIMKHVFFESRKINCPNFVHPIRWMIPIQWLNIFVHLVHKSYRSPWYCNFFGQNHVNFNPGLINPGWWIVVPPNGDKWLLKCELPPNFSQPRIINLGKL